MPLIPCGVLKMAKEFWPSSHWDQVSTSLESGGPVIASDAGAHRKWRCLTSKGRLQDTWCLHLASGSSLWEHWATTLEGHILALLSRVPAEPGLPAFPAEASDSRVKITGPSSSRIPPSSLSQHRREQNNGVAEPCPNPHPQYQEAHSKWLLCEAGMSWVLWDTVKDN